MLRTISGLLIAFALVFGFSVSAGAQDRYNCADFATKNDAQRTLDFNPADPNNLDDDDDGEACDAGVGGGSITFEIATGQTGTTPNTGTNLPSTGAGTMAGSTSTGLIAALAVAAGIFGGAGLRARRA